ncbi:MAG: TerB family tellurite resistance protein [Deltaproteobacteria bacterium]|nr:TerB family tellurite resistance protein [Deltaproteobacteria bacterium]MDD9873619.1 TerB family tellurite resistance protein [Deltaproteobacteria bacterium]
MSLLRFLGLGREDSGAGRAGRAGETASVRAIAARLERLPPESARYLASFAYVLARAAGADFEIAEEEAAEMCRSVQALAALGDDEAELVVEIARSQARLLGGTENYIVTREFRKIASREQRGQLLACLYAVAAADGTISSPESAEIAAIGEELGFTRPEINALRSRWRGKLAEFQRTTTRR